jgi:hypothetical protein
MLFSNKNFELRTKEHFKLEEEIGTAKIPAYGIKGKTEISNLVDFPDGLPIDYMHLSCLGLFKSMLIKWFDSSYHNEKFYLGN